MYRNKIERVQIDIDDRKLIELFHADDNKAFDKIVLKYQNMVFNICYRFLNNYEDADDSAQETFVKVYKNLGKFKFQSSFSTWLYRITVNTCKSRLSSSEYRQNQRMIRLDKPKNINNGNSIMEIKDEKYIPEKIIEQKEMKDILYKTIYGLPKKQKVLIVLRDIERLPYDEIANITKLKLGTVKSKIARARQVLIEKLKGVL